MSPVSSAVGRNSCGGIHFVTATPAEESLEALNLTRSQPVDGLIPDGKLFFLQSRLEVVLLLQLRGHVHMHGAVEDLVTRVTVGFGLIHGKVCVAQDLFRTGMVQGPEGDTDTGGDEDLVAIQLNGQANIVLRTFCDFGYIGNIGDVLEQDGKFISIEARDGIFRANARRAGEPQYAPADRRRRHGPGCRSLP